MIQPTPEPAPSARNVEMKNYLKHEQRSVKEMHSKLLTKCKVTTNSLQTQLPLGLLRQCQ